MVEGCSDLYLGWSHNTQLGSQVRHLNLSVGSNILLVGFRDELNDPVLCVSHVPHTHSNGAVVDFSEF